MPEPRKKRPAPKINPKILPLVHPNMIESLDANGLPLRDPLCPIWSGVVFDLVNKREKP